ncbi:PIN domain-like protein [Stereum hirsutum FP-91666 SS1]|uniref:PIN domain-like protein n=1 Tax=Stereum hirsutum (strain FP-91666) TaxID=721885 RepID=UPI0004449DCC|nr:PIN domain-like protein [Stereum hirsutum FP-91666 SS1]EIM81467.1 PIN domain-like protein [Stereum hirsutum FP-91666 SS1]
MGIKGLTALLLENAPNSIKEHDIKTLFGRKVAIDASMSIYQFLIAVRQKDGEMLTNDAGETTSHLMGFFYRTIRIVENGIKPAYVFDGKPPDLKAGVLAKRFEKREEAKEEGEEAKETGTAEDVDRFSRRTVRVTREHNAECQRLLRLMGIPVVVAPSEAEAQCAELARGGKVYAAGSEDMDTLTFSAPTLFRHLTFSEAKKAPITEVTLSKALEGLGMKMPQFIDLCILLGCDYLEPIKGVGPKTALKLIREHGGLKEVLEHLKEKQAEKEAKDAKSEPKSSTSKSKTKKSVSKSASKPKIDIESEDEDEDITPPPATSDVDLADDADFKADADSDDDEQPKPAKSKSKSKTKAKKKAVVDEDEDSDADVKEGAEKDGKEAEAEVEEEQEEKKPKKAASARRQGGVQIPEFWPWEEAKKVFQKPDVIPADEVELDWKAPDVDGLVQFLVVEKGFNEDRVRKGAEKLSKFLNAKQQGRLDGFFTVQPKAKESPAPKGKGAAKGKDAKGGKRKNDAKESGTSKKAKTKK